ncbi:MAG: Nif3-like dinuclear metal center hexameric protein [Spirochaetes bacterium]|nr:Nif3-like dinuclear metal center hexameric protein [Spirochaetota bacterium]
MDLQTLDTYFRSILKIDEFAKYDNSFNGIQVDRGEGPVRKVAFAVDACEESFRLASEWGAEVLCVHHGLLWGKELPIVGVHRKRIRFLLEHDLALYAVHLPLDADPVIGNNVTLAQRLQLQDLSPFGVYRGVEIGVQGVFPHPINVSTAAEKLFGPSCNNYHLLPFGKPSVQSVAIVSGGAASEALQAIDKGIDLFITGESSHSIYHACMEAGINVLFGGHYQTETGGVLRWAERTAQETGLETRFFDIPTGL